MGTGQAGQFHQLIDAEFILVEEFHVDVRGFPLCQVLHVLVSNRPSTNGSRRTKEELDDNSREMHMR